MENINHKELRNKARTSLKGNWGQAVLIVITYFIITIFLNTLLKDLLGTPLCFIGQLIIVPLLLGLCLYFINLPKRKQSFNDLFELFRSKLWLKALGLYIVYYIGAFIALIPVEIIFTIAFFHHHNSTLTTHTTNSIPIIALLVFFAFFIPFIIYFYTFSQITFIFLNNKDLSITSIFKESAEIMEGYKFKLFLFQFSYIGWAILSIITFGIGLLWFIPYIIEGQIMFYNEIKNTDSPKSKDSSLIIDESPSI